MVNCVIALLKILANSIGQALYNSKIFQILEATSGNYRQRLQQTFKFFTSTFPTLY